ncbi:MAG: K+-sensing histidine kinase KdpD [Candidatus Azotimanducaceae bacterium]|jgi:K+-sensing histidine kinase KdpD
MNSLFHHLKWPTLGVLFCSIAHDLYKPLAPILGNAEINTEQALTVSVVC